MMWVSIAGTSLTLFTSIVILFYRAGHLSARVEALEGWRPGIRLDMHEISTAIEIIRVDLEQVKTLILERTERRRNNRDD